jgi:SAM-dependent methyltransferase
MPSVEVAHGERVADQGEEVWCWSTPAGRERLAKRIDLFRRSLGLERPTQTLLELGCGTGLYTEQLAPLCRRLVATDISEALLDHARARVGAGHVRFVQQNLEAIQPDVLGRDFDGAYGCSVLHHLDLDATLPQMRDILKPGANLAFSEPNLLNPQVRVMFSGWEWAKRKWAVSDTEMAFYPWELRSLFERHGFEVVTVMPFDFIHPTLAPGIIPFAKRVELILEHLPLVRFLGGSYFVHARLPSS